MVRAGLCYKRVSSGGGFMRYMAETWYNSGTFWGVAGIVVAVVVGAIGVWAAFRAADPRQVVTWKLRAVVPLLTRGNLHGVGDTLEIRLDGKALDDPRTVDILMRNQGKRDISTAAFDQLRPLRLELGTPIAKLLRTESTPPEFKSLGVEVHDTAIDIGPGLFKRGQSMVISLLVDGDHPQITFPDLPFIDVELREVRDGSGYSPQKALAYAVGGGLIGIILVTLGELLGLPFTEWLKSLASASY